MEHFMPNNASFFENNNSTTFNNMTSNATNHSWPTTACPTKSRPEPMNENLRLALYILMGCVALVGIVGNVCVCFIIASAKKMYTIANLFLMNLAIADILVLSICYPLTIVRQETNWPFGNVMCKVLPAVSDCFYGVSMGCITAIAVYRYRMILHSMTTHMTFTHAKIAMMTIWIVALGIISAPLCWVLQLLSAHIPISNPNVSIPSYYNNSNSTQGFHADLEGNGNATVMMEMAMQLNSTVGTMVLRQLNGTLNGFSMPNGSSAGSVDQKFMTVRKCISKWPSNEYREAYQIVQITWYILPLSVILFTYLRIRTYLNKTLKYEWLRGGRNNNIKPCGIDSRVMGIKRALTLLAPVVVTFALLMLPWNLIRFLSLVMDISKIPHIYTYMEVAGVIMITNSCSNPFIYYIVSKEFRDGFRKRFRSITRCFKMNKDDHFFSAVSRSPSCRSQTRVERIDDENDEKVGFKNSWEKYAARVPDSPLIRQAAKRDAGKLSVRFSANSDPPMEDDDSAKPAVQAQDPDRETYI